jgi:hypothetical protein
MIATSRVRQLLSAKGNSRIAVLAARAESAAYTHNPVMRPIPALNRTKMFHVKRFGPIAG